MTFKQAVTTTPQLKGAWRAGIQALHGIDRKHIEIENPRLLKGSVDLDTALKKAYPRANRWDYGIGHRATNQGKDMVYWVEIHPAKSGEIKVVLAKLRWLKEWLENSAPKLKRLEKRFIWVSSGKTTFTPSSPQQKQLALLGLQQRGTVLRIPSRAT
jgi:hypothetical protein